MLDEVTMAKLGKLRQRLVKKEERRAAKAAEKIKPTPEQIAAAAIDEHNRVMQARGLVSLPDPKQAATTGYVSLDMDADKPEVFLDKVRKARR